MDRDGNAVAYTLNLAYGSGMDNAGTGILLNNEEMDDFAAKPGAPNAFGLIGGRQHRRARQAPAQLNDPNAGIQGRAGAAGLPAPAAAASSPQLLQIVLNTIDHGLNIAEATVAPRASSVAAGRMRVGKDSARTPCACSRSWAYSGGADTMGSTQSIIVYIRPAGYREAFPTAASRVAGLRAIDPRLVPGRVANSTAPRGLWLNSSIRPLTVHSVVRPVSGTIRRAATFRFRIFRYARLNADFPCTSNACRPTSSTSSTVKARARPR